MVRTITYLGARTLITLDIKINLVFIMQLFFTRYVGSNPALAASAEYLKWLKDWMRFTESSFSDIAYKGLAHTWVS